MSNFDQYVFTLPKAQGPIHAKLSSAWDKLRSNQRAVTMPQMRRNVLHPRGIKGNPPTFTIEHGSVGYAEIINLANTTVEHIEKFVEQAEKSKTNRKNARLIARINAVLNS